MYEFLKTRYPLAKVREGLSERECGVIDRVCAQLFGVGLPKDYRDFLTELNGFSFDGHTVFGSFDKLFRQANPRLAGSDFLENNEEYRAMTGVEDYLMLGTSSMDYLMYEIESGNYLVMTNGTMTLMKESGSFAEVLEYFFAH